jgi:hypothetical protein
MLINPMVSINTQVQELSIANFRPQPLHKAGRTETWLWVTPTINPLINKTTTANIIARHQTNVKNRHQINVQGDKIASEIYPHPQLSSVVKKQNV